MAATTASPTMRMCSQELYPTEDFPMPVKQFVLALHALTDGLVFLRFIQPELMTDDMIIAAFESLALRNS